MGSFVTGADGMGPKGEMAGRSMGDVEIPSGEDGPHRPLAFDPDQSQPDHHHQHHQQRPPMGRWKDGFCDWYKNCAPSCLMGSFLNCILLGQVAQRMNYWLRFREVAGISLALWTLSYVLYTAVPKNAGPGGVSNLTYAVFFLVVLCQLRGVVRARYAIPGDQCRDCCASMWCSCCTLTQMARHVFNYQGSCAACSMGPDAEDMAAV